MNHVKRPAYVTTKLYFFVTKLIIDEDSYCSYLSNFENNIVDILRTEFTEVTYWKHQMTFIRLTSFRTHLG